MKTTEGGGAALQQQRTKSALATKRRTRHRRRTVVVRQSRLYGIETEQAVSAEDPSASAGENRNGMDVAVRRRRRRRRRRLPSWRCSFEIPYKFVAAMSETIPATIGVNDIALEIRNSVLRAATSALWKHLYYSRGLSSLPVGQIVALLHRALSSPSPSEETASSSLTNAAQQPRQQQQQQQQPATNASSSSSSSRTNRGMVNHTDRASTTINSKNPRETRYLSKALDSIHRMEFDIRSIFDSNIASRIAHVVVVIGSSWTRPKEVYHLDASAFTVVNAPPPPPPNDALMNRTTNRNNDIDERNSCPQQQHPSAPSANAKPRDDDASKFETRLVRRFLRQVFSAENESSSSSSSSASLCNTSPSDKLSIAFGIRSCVLMDLRSNEKIRSITSIDPKGDTERAGQSQVGDKDCHYPITSGFVRNKDASIWDKLVVRHDFSLKAILQFVSKDENNNEDTIHPSRSSKAKNLRHTGRIALSIATSQEGTRSTERMSDGGEQPSTSSEKENEKDGLTWYSLKSSMKAMRSQL